MKHSCQHTAEGEEACFDCLTMGIHPAIRNVPLSDKNGKITNFPSMLGNTKLVFQMANQKDLHYVNHELINQFIQAGR